MKKLIYLFLTVLIVACSSSDDSNNDNINNNPSDLVGFWVGDTYDADDAPNGEPVSSLFISLAENGGGQWDETSYLTGVNQIYGVYWTATDTVLTLEIYYQGGSGEIIETVIVSYAIDKSGESWVINITDEEGDMFALTKVN